MREWELINTVSVNKFYRECTIGLDFLQRLLSEQDRLLQIHLLISLKLLLLLLMLLLSNTIKIDMLLMVMHELVIQQLPAQLMNLLIIWVIYIWSLSWLLILVEVYQQLLGGTYLVNLYVGELYYCAV